MAKKRQEIEAPKKVCYIAPDIRALGPAGGLIVNAITREHARRMSGAQYTPGHSASRAAALSGCKHPGRKKKSKSK